MLLLSCTIAANVGGFNGEGDPTGVAGIDSGGPSLVVRNSLIAPNAYDAWDGTESCGGARRSRRRVAPEIDASGHNRPYAAAYGL